MSGKKRHLGRGLDALLGAAAQQQPAATGDASPGAGSVADKTLKELPVDLDLGVALEAVGVDRPQQVVAPGVIMVIELKRMEAYFLKVSLLLLNWSARPRPSPRHCRSSDLRLDDGLRLDDSSS